jgi:hypothetical protein
MVLACALAIAACKTEPEVPAQQPAREEPLQLPEGPAGQAAAAHLRTMFHTGPDADARYVSSLDSLRVRPAETVALLVAAYDRAPAGRYPERWALVRTLADLRLDAAAEPLKRIASASVPPPDTGRDDVLSAFEEETKIRMTAIQGLGHLAANRQDVVTTLASLTRSSVPAIREEAARALLAQSKGMRDTVAANRMRELVPAALRNIEPLPRGPIAPPHADPRLQPLRREPQNAPRVPGGR